jgi:hypothetical protein
MSKSKIAIVLFFLVLPVVVIVLAVSAFNQSVWTLLLAVLPAWSFSLFTILYDWWDKFHFWVSRISIYLRNKDVDWELRAEYQGFESDGKLDDIMHYLAKESPKSEYIVNEESQKLIRMENFPLRLRISSEPFSSVSSDVSANFLSVDTMPMNHTFRRAQKLVEHLSHLLEHISSMLDATEQKYEIKIRFSDVNPYFGFYIQRVKQPSVTRFDCELSEQVGGFRHTVIISEKEIIIVTNSISSLLILARDYLSLASTPQRDLLHSG